MEFTSCERELDRQNTPQQFIGSRPSFHLHTIFIYEKGGVFSPMDCSLNTSVMGQEQSKTSPYYAIYLDTWFTVPRPCAVCSLIARHVSL